MNYSYNLFLNPREIEMKFTLADGVRETLEASAPFVAVKHKTQHQVTTYFDTPDALLNAAGLSLRVRKMDDGARFQTVKSRQSGLDIAADRGEWEWTSASDDPDVTKLMKIPALSAFAGQIEGRLQPVFVSDIQRTVRLLYLDGNATVEAVIDIGAINSGTKSEPVSELELELKSGDVQSMYRLASQLVEIAPLRFASESKAARGWRLRTGQTEGIREAKAPLLRRGIPAAEGFHQIIGGTLGHLIANIEPTLTGDPEGLHQMRRGLRDARAALKLFDTYLGETIAVKFDGKLRRYGQMFGIARDWDVFCLQTLPAAMADLPAERLRDLNEVAEVQRQIAHSAVVDALRSAKFTALLLDITVWAGAGAKQPSTFGDVRMDKPMLSLAPKLLTRAARRVEKKAHKSGSLSAKELHSLRKAFDSLGDDLRFLSSLYPGKNLTAYKRRCKAIKTILGSNNDAFVTGELAATLKRDGRPDLAKPAAALGLWTDKKHRAALKALKPQLSHFRKCLEFWAA